MKGRDNMQHLKFEISLLGKLALISLHGNYENKIDVDTNQHGYLQSQHSPPALNCPLKWSTELTPVPLHWEHIIAPGWWIIKKKIVRWNFQMLMILTNEEIF